MSDLDLTAQQELFLEYLFNDAECARDTKKASAAAGYSREYHWTLVRQLKDEILKRTNEELAISAPKAMSKLLKAMDEDGTTPKADLRLKAVESILDRIGLAKKQELNISVDNESPLFIIPEKKEVVIETTNTNDEDK
jgi:hypothetical protein